MSRNDYRFGELRDVLTHADVSAPEVSRWSIGMHVHHCCLSMLAIAGGLAKSKPPAPAPRLSLPRFAVLASGKIPRGRAQTAAHLAPRPSAPRAEIVELLEESARQIDDAGRLGRNTWVTHPILGPLRRDAALKFARIHNHHHLQIISDILKRQAKNRRVP